MEKIKSFFYIILIICFLSGSVLALTPDQESLNDPLVRIKDITRIKGVRDNQLLGYGLVVGLNGTGDGNNSQFTVQSVANMLRNFGVIVDPEELGMDNVAAVMVTAKLPPFVHEGSEIDVTLSSIGDADSLQGGTLLMTPLYGPAGNEVYAVAQGSVSIGGFNEGGGGNQVRQNHTTVGRVPNGALIEKEVPMSFTSNEHVTLVLANPNFATAQRISDVINGTFGYTPQGGYYAQAIDAGQVEIKVPNYYENKVVNFISRLEQLEVRPDTEAKVVINERTGTIVMGHNVRLSKVSVAHGNLTVTIATQENVSQPDPFTDGQTEVTEETDIDVSEENSRLMVLPKGSSIADVVKGLNAVGASPRDIIAILQAIKQSGALHAELEIM
ncbi:flagellar P-ring protein precursor FlgI [Orenia metallireducens]|jgi:flagellar P-ring protein precursor FlgI|uniref:Flagellar P-ring protein n=1 Tax=Orenia metallireducens TaxID=1413210 RepID=A0A285GLN7_9FIRM|nr:flagellar basal body P-ring protein FlgI [Orenia metallireducens]PRX35746.1 flagellar P-ring protein precursor FlgI [Orenia metallireducens]SNY24233.1 flagellar P-ring protein precursor FlgI [Orenia metallireducens]